MMSQLGLLLHIKKGFSVCRISSITSFRSRVLSPKREASALFPIAFPLFVEGSPTDESASLDDVLDIDESSTE